MDKKTIEILELFLIFFRDNDLKYKPDDAYDRGYILNDVNMSKEEIINEFIKWM